MDFNLILLLAGLGLLLMVILFALWGFLGGLKRELKCIAVFIVLLVLAWIVFGDSATLLNAKFGKDIADLLGLQDSGSISTVWDAVLAYARANVPNGEALLVEGKETYTLFYSVASTVCHAVGILVGTIAILIICPIIRLISHIVGLIIRGVKRRNAKKNPPVENAEVDEKGNEMVVIPKAKETEEAVLVKDENEIETKPAGKRRLWGALAGALKGVFVVILICVPLSGISSILGKFTPETKMLVKDVVNGKAEVKVSESSDDPVDMAFEFAKAYDESALGKFANMSSFFFGESFSERLFDQMFKLETKNQVIYLSEELETFIEVANCFEGKLDFTQLSKKQFATITETLKDSKLLVELMPVAIEYVYEIESFQKILVESGQDYEFLNLRYNNWKHDIDLILDAVKEAYDLKLFPIAEFNYLTMDAEVLRDVVKPLGETELMNDALPLGVCVLLNLEAIRNHIGIIAAPKFDGFDAKKELDDLVTIYAKFQKFGIESFNGFDFNEFLKEVIADEEKTDLTFEIIKDALDLQLVEKLAVPVLFGYVRNNEKIFGLIEKANATSTLDVIEFNATIDDIKAYVDVVRLALKLVDLSEFPEVHVDYFHLDVDVIDRIIEKLFTRSITDRVISLGLDIVLALDPVKEALGNALDDVNLKDIDWHTELQTLASIYREFLKLEFESVDDFKGDAIELIQSLLENEKKFGALSQILSKLVDLQLYDKLAVPSMQHFLDEFVDKNYDKFSDIIDLSKLTKDEWKQDLQTVLESAKLVNELGVLDNLNPFDYKNLDIASSEGIAKIKQLISNIFGLNILGNDELKTKLLIASIRQFNWTYISDDIMDGTATWNIRWDNEESVLLQLVDIYEKVIQLEGFDIFDLKNTKWVDLLEDDLFLDYIVETLETVIESDIVLEILPGLLDKYLLPVLEGIDNVDDDTLFRDIFKNLPSEELVNEIIKLVDVLRAAVDMHLLGAKSIDDIDFTNIEALKKIVSGIFDSKIIQGFEGRIIRIILKVTKLLEIDKNSDVYEKLVSLDYSGEKDVLLEFIDAIAPVLQDPNFKLTDENGKFKLDLKFFAEDSNARAILEGLKVLFGSYPENDYTGSKLIETLLPNIYAQHLEDKIPDEFRELLDELDIKNATGELLVSDLRRVIYIVEMLIELNAHALVNGGDMDISSRESVKIYNSILDALHDIQIFRGHESKVLAWGINYLANKLNIEVDKITDEFDGIDWLAENELYKEIISDFAKFLRKNSIFTVNDLRDFFNNKVYLEDYFITNNNAKALLDILDKIVDVKVIDAILPFAIKYGVKVLDEKTGILADYLNEFTSDELVHDFHKLIQIAHKLVDELDIISYYKGYMADFVEDMPLPNEDALKSLVDDIFELYIIGHANGRLASLIANEIFKKVNSSFFLTAEDFAVDTVDWESEKEIIKDLISLGYEFLRANGIDKMSLVKQSIDEKWYNSPAILRDETGHILAEALRVLSNSQLVSNVIVKAYQYGFDQLTASVQLPFDISYLRGMSRTSLLADLNTFADLLDMAVDFGLMEYLAIGDIHDMDLNIAGDIVENLYRLNILKEHGHELLQEVYNYLLGLVETSTNYEFKLTRGEINSIDVQQELAVFANMIRSLNSLFDAKAINTLNELIDFITDVNKDALYKEKAFYDIETYNALIDLAYVATDLQVLELVAPKFVNYLVDTAKGKNIDLSFITTDEYTASLVIEDIKTALKIARLAYNFGILDLVFDKTLYTIEIDPLCDMLDLVPQLNLLQLYFKDLLVAGVNHLLKLAKIEITVTKDDFADVTLEHEIAELIDIILVAKELLDEKEVYSYNDLVGLLNGSYPDNSFKTGEFYDEATGAILEKLVTEAADLGTVQALLPKLLNYGVDKVTRVDLSFLKDAFTKEELTEDVKLFAKLIVPAIKADLVKVLFGMDINNLVFAFDAYQEMLDVIKDSNILNKKYADFIALGTNLTLDKLNSLRTVTADQFEGASFRNDVEAFKDVVVALDNLTFALRAYTVYDLRLVITDLFQNNNYKEPKYANKVVAGYALDALGESLDLEAIKLLLPTIFTHICDYAYYKGTDIYFILDYVSQPELVEDTQNIIFILRDIVKVGTIEFLLADGKLDLNSDLINDAIVRFAYLHMLEKNHAKLILLLLDKLGIDTTDVNLDNIDLDLEVETIQDIVKALVDLLVLEGVDEKDEFKNLPSNLKEYLKVNENTNDQLEVTAALLKALSKDQLVERLAFAVAKKYLASLSPKYDGLVDIYNIYSDVKEFTSDLSDLADILLDLRELNIYSFIVENGNYPYERVDVITEIIRLTLSLNYFNVSETRLDEFVKALDGHVKQDLSYIDAIGVDLRADADKFAEMYEYLSVILTHEYFPIKNKDDLKPIKLNKQLFASTLVQEYAIDSILKFMETTVFVKTGAGLVMSLGFPLVEKHAPKYYEALELAYATKDMVEYDLQLFRGLLEALDKLDLGYIAETREYFTVEIHNIINILIDMIADSKLLDNHGNALFELLVNDFVNGKTVLGVDVPNGTFTADGVDFDADYRLYKLLVDEIFDYLANNNCTTLEELRNIFNDFKANTKSFVLDTLSKETNCKSIENILAILSEMTMVDANGLAVMTEIVYPKVSGNADLAVLLDFRAFSKKEFASDLDALALLMKQLNEFGLSSVLRNENINYDQASLVKDMINNLASTYYVKYNLYNLIDLVDSKNLLPIKLEALKTSEFKYKADAALLGEAYEELLPFLTCEDNFIKTKSDIMAFIRGKFALNSTQKAEVKAHKYDFVDAYDVLSKTTALPLLFEAIADYAKTKLPAGYQKVIDMMEISELTFDEKQKDALQSAVILRTLVDLGAWTLFTQKDYNFEGTVISTLGGKEVEVDKVSLLATLVDEIYPLNVLRNRSGLVFEVLNALGTDTTDVDLSNIDWDNELAQFKTVLTNTLTLLLQYDIQTIKGTKEYAKDLVRLNSYNALVDELKSIYHKVELSRGVTIIEALDKSEAFDQIFKPLYNKYVFPNLPTKLVELGDLSEYTVSNLDEDMHYLAIMARKVLEMKRVPGSLKANAENAACVIPAQEFIEALFSLNYLDLKKQALVNFIGSSMPSLELDTLDVTNVDLKADGQVFAQYAKQLLIIFTQTDYARNRSISQLGNTYLMTAVVELYNGVLDTDLAETVINWMFRHHVEPRLDGIESLSNYEFTDAKIHSAAVKFGDALDAMLDMGVFSNNGIDFTNTDATDRLFDILSDALHVVSNSDNVDKLINKFKANVASEFGIVPLSYEGLENKTELKALKNAVSSVLSFVKNYANKVKADYTTLVDEAFQNDLTNCFEKVFDSQIMSQLCMPLMSGTVRILTKDIVTLHVLDDVNNDQFVNKFLPDLYELFGALNKLGVLSKTVKYNDADAILGVADVLVHAGSFEEHTGDIFKFAMCFIGVNIKDADLSSVDWEVEFNSLDAALNEIKEPLKNVKASNKKTVLNNEFLSALANATPYFENSELLPLVAREFADFIVSNFLGSEYDLYVNRLYDASYTNKDLMNDYGRLDEILLLVVECDYFGKGISYSNLDPLVSLLELVFELKYSYGLEAKILSDGFNHAEIFKDYEFDFDAVTNWSVERERLIAALQALSNFTKHVALDNVTADSMKDEENQALFIELVDAMSKSEVGQQLLPQIYKERVEENLGDDYSGIINFDDPEFTPDLWKGEFEKLFEEYNVLVNNGFGSDEGLSLTVTEAIRVMEIQFGTRGHAEDGIMAVVKNPELWVKKMLDSKIVALPTGAELDLTTDRDWLEEAYNIIEILNAMKPFANDEDKFEYANVYYCTEASALEALLVASNNCVASRASSIQIIHNTLTFVNGMEEALRSQGVIDDAFDLEYAKYEADPTHTYYNAEYWTSEKISQMAAGIATVNEYLQNN